MRVLFDVVLPPSLYNRNGTRDDSFGLREPPSPEKKPKYARTSIIKQATALGSQLVGPSSAIPTKRSLSGTFSKNTRNVFGLHDVIPQPLTEQEWRAWLEGQMQEVTSCLSGMGEQVSEVREVSRMLRASTFLGSDEGVQRRASTVRRSSSSVRISSSRDNPEPEAPQEHESEPTRAEPEVEEEVHDEPRKPAPTADSFSKQPRRHESEKAASSDSQTAQPALMSPEESSAISPAIAGKQRRRHESEKAASSDFQVTSDSKLRI